MVGRMSCGWSQEDQKFRKRGLIPFRAFGAQGQVASQPKVGSPR